MCVLHRVATISKQVIPWPCQWNELVWWITHLTKSPSPVHRNVRAHELKQGSLTQTCSAGSCTQWRVVMLKTVFIGSVQRWNCIQGQVALLQTVFNSRLQCWKLYSKTIGTAKERRSINCENNSGQLPAKTIRRINCENNPCQLPAKTIRICVLFETFEKRLNNFQTTHVNRSDKEQEDSCGQNVRKIPWAKCLEIYLDRMFEKFLGRNVEI